MTQLEKEYQSRVRRMESMLEVLNYLLAHLEEPLSAEQVALKFDYNKKYFEGIFAEYFGMPFHRFLKKIRLRKAAEALVKNGTVKKEWSRYGFESNVSFSSGFKKEFGVSPKKFLEMGEPAPSMPERGELFGIPIRVEYQKVEEMTLSGYPMETVHGNQTDLLAEAAYALDHTDPHVELDALEEWYGIWWFDRKEKEQLKYLTAAAPSCERGFHDCSLETVVIPEDEYAVFSCKRRENAQENALAARLLARYALTEWKLLANKRPNSMGWTFERFDRERNYLYVPIIDLEEDTVSIPNRSSGVDTWAVYIDKHIREDLTLSSLAGMAHYTVKSFRDIFTMYYAIDPVEYIQKRRLYEAAGELSRCCSMADGSEKKIDGRKLRRIAEKYRFPSFKIFQEQFREEFHEEPESYQSIHFGAVDLNQVYEQNKEQLTVTLEMMEDLYFVGKAIKSGSPEQDYQDISMLASFWFREDYPELKKMMPDGNLEGITKAALWDSRTSETDGETLYEYMLGPVTNGRSLICSEGLPEGFRCYHLRGGRNMVFSTQEPSDREQLTGAFRLLTRCAFFGWIREHFYQYDGERLTYVKYENEKLYFYVPVKG